LPDGGQMLLQTFPAAWSAKRVEGLESVIADAGIEVVDTWEADPTNMVDGTNADVTTKLQQFPDVDAVWINFSVASIGAAQAIGALPEDQQPLLVTFYANPATLADINAGRVDAAVDEALEWQSWAGVDAVMQLIARGQEPSQERAPTYNGVNLSVRQVIDSSNAPADGEAIASPVDYVGLFQAKWCTEFTNLPNC
jgi:ABC-type sugar transport system substrate-binding protein